MTTHWPSNIYGEEILRWEWWLYTILVVVWGWNVVVGGFVEFWHSRKLEDQNPEIPDKRECNAAREEIAPWRATSKSSAKRTPHSPSPTARPAWPPEHAIEGRPADGGPWQ